MFATVNSRTPSIASMTSPAGTLRSSLGCGRPHTPFGNAGPWCRSWPKAAVWSPSGPMSVRRSAVPASARFIGAMPRPELGVSASAVAPRSMRRLGTAVVTMSSNSA